MTNNDIREAYDSLTPTSQQKKNMLDAILSEVPASHRKENTMKFYKRKPALAAVMVAMAILLTGCAAAAILGLKDLKMGEFISEGDQFNPEKTWNVISLQGFAGSPGYLASQEWQAYFDTCDPKGETRMWNQYHHIEMPPEYDAFSCYTPEMMEKLDEICEKYDLKLPGKGWQIKDVSRIYEATGIRDVLVEGNPAKIHLDYGHCYADGSFYVEGGAQFPGQRVGDMMSMNCVRKGSFGNSTDSISEIENFDQWYYTLKDGSEVLLADYKEEVLMIADREDFFITIRFYGEGVVYIMDQAEKRKAVEAMADCFDFSIQPHEADPAILDKSEEDWDQMWEELDQQNAQDSRFVNYEAFMYNHTYLRDQNWEYAMHDLDGDGTEELFLSFQGGIRQIITYDGTVTSLVLDTAGAGEVQLCENGIFRSKDSLNNCFAYTYFRVEDRKPIPFDFVEYHDEAPAHWGRSQDGDFTSETELTETEAEEIIDSYKIVELDWKSVEEFPMD